MSYDGIQEISDEEEAFYEEEERAFIEKTVRETLKALFQEKGFWESLHGSEQKPNHCRCDVH